MPIVFGALIGYVFGRAVWLVSKHFAPIYQTATIAQDARFPWKTTNSAGPSLAVLVQLLMACWGAYVRWRLDSPLDLLIIMATTAVLLAVAVIDFQTRRIPDVTILALLVSAALQVLLLAQPELLAAGLGLLICGGIFYVIALLGRGAMGMGDVKLAAAIGALLGFPVALEGLFLGIVFGGLAAVVLLLTKRAGRKDPFAYGPWLALGAWIVLVQAWGLWPF